MIIQQVALVQIFIYTCTDTLYATRNELCEIISYKITVWLHCFSLLFLFRNYVEQGDRINWNCNSVEESKSN